MGFQPGAALVPVTVQCGTLLQKQKALSGLTVGWELILSVSQAAPQP